MEKDERDVTSVQPLYIVLLIAAGILYIMNSCIMQSSLCVRVARAEHKLLHLTGEHSGVIPK